MNNNYPSPFLSPGEIRQLLGERPDAVVLDIRTAREYREQRVPGSLHLDRLEMTSGSIARTLPGGEAPVLVCCRTGLHSKDVAARLRGMGYAAYDIGSIHDWPGSFEGTLV